jgi:capsid assembly protease
MKKQLLLAQFVSMPWAITPDYLALMAGVLTNWAFNIPVSVETMDKIDDDKGIMAARQSANRSQPGQIVVIPVYGALMQRPPQDISGPGATSTSNIIKQVKQVASDPNVSKILLDIDSPGGSVYGTSELANIIYQTRQQKPIIGIANSMSASAAYWIGSQCTEFYCTPSGEVGSIGVYTAHQCIAKALEAAGIDTTLISAGKYKTEGNPFEPLSKEAQAMIQAKVDDYYTMFLNDVSRGRNVSVKNVKDGMGDGRIFGASKSLELNMVDGVMAFDELIDTLVKAQPSRSRLSAARQQLTMM